jgi:uncharacterized protein
MEEIFTEKERNFIRTQLGSLYNKNFDSLSEIKPEEILNSEELLVFNSFNEIKSPTYNFLPPHLFVIMKATRLCNLRCKYCHSWKDGLNQKMSFEVLCKTIRESLSDGNSKIIDFIWHGGETLIMTKAFYTKALWLQNFYKKQNQKISNSLQTNATLINEDWIDFFKKYNFSIGVSLDGPAEINDEKRIYKNGNPTSKIIINKLELLNNSGVKAGLLLVIDERSIQYGAKNILDFLVEIKATNIALLNVIPDSNESGSFISFDVYTRFLITLFDEWWKNYKDQIMIRELSSLVNQIKGEKPSICVFAGGCLGQFLTIEPEGGVSACDKYIGNADYYFGNILQENLSKLVMQSDNYNRKKQQLYNESKTFSQCENYLICNGGCPHDNMLRNGKNENDCCGLYPLISHIKRELS